MIRTRSDEALDLISEFRVDIEDYLDTLIVPHRGAPVVTLENDKLVLSAMNFSLVPRWSKVRRPKFATHNARIESIASKPTWREAFQKRHCLVPLTHFVEPIYEGELSGFMVAFHRTDGNWLFAAGIWEDWIDPSTGEILSSFSIITAEPPPFVKKTGHDRCPVFLPPTDLKEWLSADSHTSPEWLDYLKSQVPFNDFSVDRFRPMKPGWEKRK